jgi:hypothetical protein
MLSPPTPVLDTSCQVMKPPILPSAFLMLALQGSILTGLTLPVRAQDQTQQFGINRPGSDLGVVELSPRPPGEPDFTGPRGRCEPLCIGTRGCQSWTYVKANIQGPKERCWLKRGIPNAISDPNTVSGVIQQSLEFSTNRSGGDYKSFDVQDSRIGITNCRQACLGEPSRCRSWRWVRSGVQGPRAKCWLKDKIPFANVDPNTVSGVTPPFVR